MNNNIDDDSEPPVGDEAEGHYNFQKQCLDIHNAVRERHGCRPLHWSKELAEHAQMWAEKLAERGYLMYYDSPGLGENIQMFPLETENDIVSGKSVAMAWAKEGEKFDFRKMNWQKGTNHFTQMIWKSTTEVGIGRSLVNGQKKVVVVAFYKPAGNSNYPGNFDENISPAK